MISEVSIPNIILGKLGNFYLIILFVKVESRFFRGKSEKRQIIKVI